MTERQFTDRLLIFSIVLATVVTGLMGYYLGTREVVVPENARFAGKEEYADVLEGVSFDEAAIENVISIPLPESVSEEDVAVSVDILNKEISIEINGIEDGYFYSNSLSGDSNHIERLLYGYDSERVLIEAKMTEGLDCTYSITDTSGKKALVLELKNPADIYRKIIVINPAHGGEDSGTVCYDIYESEINLRFAKALAVALEERGIKGILVRNTDDEVISDDERIKRIETISSDAVITVRCAGDASSRVTYGMHATCNDEDAELTGLILDRCSLRTGSKNMGVETSEDEDTSINLYIGYLTNKAEALLLNSNDYLNNIAEGVAIGIDGFYK